MTATPELREAIELLAQHARSSRDVDETLHLLTRSAVDTIPGVDYCSVSMKRHDGPIETLAPTHPVVVAVDELQYDLYEGPCYEVVNGASVVLSNDMAREERWPRFGPKAADLGVASHLALVLVAEHGRRASLNLYSKRRNSFDGNVELADLFASQAALVLGLADTIEHLDRALGTREIIGQAVGVLMERHDLDHAAAFAYLVRSSQDGNLKLRLVAAQIVNELEHRHRREAPGLPQQQGQPGS